MCTLYTFTAKKKLKRTNAKRSKESLFPEGAVGQLTREVHEALYIPYESLEVKVICIILCTMF